MMKPKTKKPTFNSSPAPKSSMQAQVKGVDKPKAANRRDFSLVTREFTCYTLGYD